MSIFKFITRKRRVRKYAFKVYNEFIETYKKEQKKLCDKDWLILIKRYIKETFQDSDKETQKAKQLFLLYFFLTPELLDKYLAVFIGLSLFSRKRYYIKDVQFILENSRYPGLIPIMMMNYIEPEVSDRISLVIAKLDALHYDVTQKELHKIAIQSKLSYVQVKFLHQPLEFNNSD